MEDKVIKRPSTPSAAEGIDKYFFQYVVAFSGNTLIFFLADRP